MIGGLVDTGLWVELSEKFTAATGHRVEVVARGPKSEICPEFMAGHADLITMHASDAMINLVADGYAVDPQPWARNDFIIVGPPDDPAGIKGTHDTVQALGKIIDSKNKFLIHAAVGVQEVLHEVMEAGQLQFDAQHLLVRVEDKQRQMLLIAGTERAYTLIGRIPFLNGRLPKQDLVVMVQGDPRLRKSYLVATVNPERFPKSQHAAAQELVRYLRHPETQKWIAEYGRGQYDNQPLFFPVSVPER